MLFNDMERLATNEDHRPSGLSCTMDTWSKALDWHSWRDMRFDRKLLEDEHLRTAFEDELEKMRPPPWSTPIDQHYTVQCADISRMTMEHFGKKREPPRRPFVGDQTWAVIRCTCSKWKCCKKCPRKPHVIKDYTILCILVTEISII